MQNFARSSPRVESDSTFCAKKMQYVRNNLYKTAHAQNKFRSKKCVRTKNFAYWKVGFKALSLLSTRRNFSCEHIFSIEICSGHAQFCTNYFAHTAFSSHKKLNHFQLLANFARSSACMASRSNMKLGKQLRFTRTEATLLLQIAF